MIFLQKLDHRISRHIVIILLLCGYGTVAEGNERNIQDMPVQEYDTLNPGTTVIPMSTVYKRSMEYPEPLEHIPVRVNPPVLRWPRQVGTDVLYDVRLAKEFDFSNPEKTLGRESLPWAMYNPHQKLEQGTWYWQYRKSGESWSETYSFVVDSNAIELVSPPAKKFLQAIPGEHPRVLINKSAIPALRESEVNSDIQAILKDAEQAMFIKIPDEDDDLLQRDNNALEHLRGKLPDEQVDSYYEEQRRKRRLDASKRLGDIVSNIAVPLTQGYILSGDERYAKKAIETALQVATWDPDGVSMINDFGDSRCMLAMAIVYDTFYDRLSKEQRSKLLSSIIPRASRFYNNWTNDLELRLVSGHVWQHILHYLFQTALALYDDVPEAEDWLQYIYEVFLARAPLLGGMDGGWTEGVSYFPMNTETMIDIPLYIKEYTGFDFINNHPWYSGQVEWMMYHIPPGSAADGFGDNTEEITSPGTNYAAFSLELAKLTGNPLAAWYYHEIAKYEDLDLSEKKLLRWIRLTKTRDLERPEVPDDTSLSMGKAFRDIGLVAMHTNPDNTPENLMVAMRSSPFGSYGHMLSDQNVFNILHGGQKLFYRTGYKVTMQDPHRTGWYQNTKSQNGILVNGHGQPYSTEAFGWIARFLQGKELSYAKGDASNAYQSEMTGEDYGVLKNFRHLVLLKPDIVIIYDELEAKNEVEWSWLIHSLEELSIDQKKGSFSASLDHANGVGRLWASQKVVWELTDEFEVPAVNWRESRGPDGNIRTYDDDQWHLKATNDRAAKKMRFLAVIQVAPGADMTDLLQGNEDNGTIGIKSGNWDIKANIDTSKPPELQIRNEKTGTRFTSHANAIQADGQQYKGNYSGSSKLIEMQNGKPVFHEVVDEMPYIMKSRLNNYELNH